VVFSAVGLNKDRNRAVVFVEYYGASAFGASGGAHFFAKKDGKWIDDERAATCRWIA